MRAAAIGLIASIVLSGCTTVPRDPNTSRADDEVREQAFPGCEPATDIPPTLISGRTPIYPVNRLLAEEDGYAVLTFDVKADGRVANVEKVESSHPLFASHTKIAVVDWVFRPAEQDGVAVAVRCGFRQTFSVPFKHRR